MNLKIRKAKLDDIDILFEWANDEYTRNNSFNTELIKWSNHKKWYYQKFNNPNSFIFIICSMENKPIGVVRIEKKINESVIGITLSSEFRGKGLGSKIIMLGCKEFWKTNGNDITAYIKKTNIASIRSFEKAAFQFDRYSKIDGNECLILKANKDEFNKRK